MAGKFIDHIDLRVAAFAVAVPFYDALMAALGMQRVAASERWVEYGYGQMTTPYFALTEDTDHRADATRIAFAAESKDEVDRVGAAVRASGAVAVEGPEFCPEYHPGYYAVFFEDPDGNRFEVCCHTAG